MPIILQNAKFLWTEEKISQFIRLWNDGWDVKQIAAIMYEHPDDIALLVIDQAQKGKITKRTLCRKEC